MVVMVKMLKALSLVSNSKACEELRSVAGWRFLALLFLERQTGADRHDKTEDHDRRRNPRHGPAEGNVIVIRSEPAIANAPDFPRDQKQRADTIVAEHFTGIGAWSIVRSSWWHGTVGLEHHRGTHHVHQGPVLSVFSLGRVHLGNLLHRHLHQLILRLQPIIHFIAILPAALNIKFVGARRNLGLCWLCNAHADKYEKLKTGLQARTYCRNHR